MVNADDFAFTLFTKTMPIQIFFLVVPDAIDQK